MMQVLKRSADATAGFGIKSPHELDENDLG